MDKSPFVALFHMRGRVTREFIYTCSALPPTPTPPPPTLQRWARVHAISPGSFNIVLGGRGGATHFEADNRAFLKFAFKKEN